jgi:hypothetical protein
MLDGMCSNISNVLQSNTQAHQQRVAVTRRVRTTAKTEAAGCLENQGYLRLMNLNQYNFERIAA